AENPGLLRSARTACRTLVIGESGTLGATTVPGARGRESFPDFHRGSGIVFLAPQVTEIAFKTLPFLQNDSRPQETIPYPPARVRNGRVRNRDSPAGVAPHGRMCAGGRHAITAPAGRAGRLRTHRAARGIARPSSSRAATAGRGRLDRHRHRGRRGTARR